jgi:Glutamate dehydrogenase, ACT1 domain
MELGNHGLSARLVIHPQLRVRRDVTGALHTVVGTASAGQVSASESSHDELAESWTHI